MNIRLVNIGVYCMFPMGYYDYGYGLGYGMAQSVPPPAVVNHQADENVYLAHHESNDGATIALLSFAALGSLAGLLLAHKANNKTKLIDAVTHELKATAQKGADEILDAAKKEAGELRIGAHDYASSTKILADADAKVTRAAAAGEMDKFVKYRDAKMAELNESADAFVKKHAEMDVLLAEAKKSAPVTDPIVGAKVEGSEHVITKKGHAIVTSEELAKAEEAAKAEAEREAKKAAEEAENALRDAKDKAKIDGNNANILLNKGKAGEAFDLLKQIPEELRKANDWNNMAVCLEKTGKEEDLAEAFKCLEKAADGEYAIGHANLGHYHRLALGTPKNLDEAIKNYEIALKIDPKIEGVEEHLKACQEAQAADKVKAEAEAKVEEHVGPGAVILPKKAASADAAVTPPGDTKIKTNPGSVAPNASEAAAKPQVAGDSSAARLTDPNGNFHTEAGFEPPHPDMSSVGAKPSAVTDPNSANMGLDKTVADGTRTPKPNDTVFEAKPSGGGDAHVAGTDADVRVAEALGDTHVATQPNPNLADADLPQAVRPGEVNADQAKTIADAADEAEKAIPQAEAVPKEAAEAAPQTEVVAKEPEVAPQPEAIAPKPAEVADDMNITAVNRPSPEILNAEKEAALSTVEGAITQPGASSLVVDGTQTMPAPTTAAMLHEAGGPAPTETRIGLKMFGDVQAKAKAAEEVTTGKIFETTSGAAEAVTPKVATEVPAQTAKAISAAEMEHAEELLQAGLKAYKEQDYTNAIDLLEEALNIKGSHVTAENIDSYIRCLGDYISSDAFVKVGVDVQTKYLGKMAENLIDAYQLGMAKPKALIRFVQSFEQIEGQPFKTITDKVKAALQAVKHEGA